MAETAETDKNATKPVQTKASLLRRVLTGVGGLLAFLVLVAAYLWFFQQPHHSAPREAQKAIAASGDGVLDSIRKGVEYLRVHQEDDGAFSKGLLDPKPGFTAMAVDSIARSPDKPREADHPWLKKAAANIISYQNKDGSISTPMFGLDTYTTSVGLMALNALENPEYAPAIARAKEYLISVQYRDDEANNPNFGAAGYTPGGRTSGDLTSLWIEALKDSGMKEGDPAFANAQKFLSRLQNNPETNDRKDGADWTIDKDGGFFYRPGESKPKDGKAPDGKRILRSYGLMSYAGLKSFLYTGVDKSEPRVQSAYKWARDNYTLDENRNIGPDGLFYYYLTMSKAFAAYGEPIIETSDGVKHDWAKELSDKLISLQNTDGSWQNRQSDRWKEDDAVLVTSYALRTMTICHEALAGTKK
jgi:squalene-hopene/tetraprenyl-beta-curcumene cyclase